MDRRATTIIPLALLAGVSLAVLLAGQSLAELDRAWWIEYLPLIVFLIAALVGGRMNHSRITFLALVGLFTFLAAGSGGTTEPVQRATALAAGLAVCVYTLLCAHWRERGLVTEPGVLRLLLVVGPMAVLWGLVATRPATLVVLLPRFFAAPLFGRLLPLPWPVLLGALAVGALLTARLPRHPLETPVLPVAMAAMLLGLGMTSPRFVGWGAGGDMAVRLAAGRVACSLFMGVAALVLLLASLEHSYGSAYLDELTGLPGRRALEQRLSALGSRFAVAMVDIDHFKRVNDRYGHAVGDQALRFIAGHLRDIKGGNAYRYGGEEFAVVLPRRGERDALGVMEDIRGRIAEGVFHLRANGRPAAAAEPPTGSPTEGIPLTVSVGIAAVARGELTPEEALDEADRALYRAKELGRNRTVRRSELKEDEPSLG